MQATDVVWRFFGESCDVIMSKVDAWSIDLHGLQKQCFHCVYEPSAMDMIRMGFIFQSEAYHVFWEVVLVYTVLIRVPKTTNGEMRERSSGNWDCLVCLLRVQFDLISLRSRCPHSSARRRG